MNIDENGLIAQILDGDTEHFSALIDRHKESIYRHCFYIVHDEDVAEDMAQQAFIKAYTHLRKFNGDKAGFRTWLSAIATRECLTHLRRRKTLPLENDDAAPSTLADTDQLARDRELHDAVMRLEPKYRTVISLYYWHGYQYADIARAMDAPVGSVRGWIHRAKKLLKEALS
jgi:RNA polymerase sigma-70 factor (ECF subfamily)